MVKPSYQDTLTRVKNILEVHLGVEPTAVDTDSSFVDDLGADSLDNIELAMAFEEEFEIEIEDSEAATFNDVDDAVKFINNAIESKTINVEAKREPELS